MLLGDLIKFARKDHGKICVKGISFDSRRVKKGDIFFAIKGNKTSGIKFINEAIINGAVAVASDQRIKNIIPSASFIEEFNEYLNTLKNISY